MNAAVSKTVVRLIGVPRVRISPPPFHLTVVRRKDCERPALQGSDGAEMTFVEADEASGSVSKGEDYQCAVGESKLEVCIARVESADRGVVLALQAGHCESPRGDIGDEIPLRPAASGAS